MSLQKKCFTASAVAHGLLLVLVFVGSAFIPQQAPPPPGPVFELFTMPDEIVEDPAEFSGGNPNVTEPPAPAPVVPPVQQPVIQQPVPQPPAVTPQRAPDPQPPVREQSTPEPLTPQRAEPEPKEEEPNPFDLSKARPNRRETPKIEQPKPSNNFDLSKVERRKIAPPATRNNSAPAPDSRDTAQTGQMAKNFSDTLSRVRGNLSSVGGSYDVPGPGGPSRASYTAYLAYEYRRAWVAPSKSTSRAPVDVEVVIARDGSVISYKIRPSGNRQADAAAEATMKRIRRFEKAPPGNSPQVTYRFTFTPED